jgi:hypothetical protein
VSSLEALLEIVASTVMVARVSGGVLHLVRPVSEFEGRGDESNRDYWPMSVCSLIWRFRDGSVRRGEPTCWHCKKRVRSGNYLMALCD